MRIMFLTTAHYRLSQRLAELTNRGRRAALGRSWLA